MLYHLEVIYPSTLAMPVRYSRLERGEGASILMAIFMLTNCHLTRLSDVPLLHLFSMGCNCETVSQLTQDFATLLQKSGFGNSLKVAPSMNPIGFD